MCLRIYKTCFNLVAHYIGKKEGPLCFWNCYRGAYDEINATSGYSQLKSKLSSQTWKLKTLDYRLREHCIFLRKSILKSSNVQSCTRLFLFKRINCCQHIVERNVRGYLLHYFMIWTDSVYLRQVPSCSLSDVVQFLRHLSLKNENATKTTQTEEAASWGHFSICICSARNRGGSAAFYSGPDSILRVFCGEWKENKMKPLSSSSATVQWPFLLQSLICSFHPCRVFRPSPYLPCESCSQASCTERITHLSMLQRSPCAAV